VALDKECNPDIDTHPIGTCNGLMLVCLLNKNTDCQDLGTALMHLLGFKVGLQFKTIHTGAPTKPQALAVNLLADKVDTPPIMEKLNEIYSEVCMNNWAASYPLGQ